MIAFSMLEIEHVQDRETLRQIALILDREVKKLHVRLQQLAAENARLRGQDATQAQQLFELELTHLEALLKRKEDALQKRIAHSGANESSATPKPARRGHGPRAQPRLPIQEVLHTLPESDRMCPVCDGTVSEMRGQTEDSEEITVVERRFVILKHRRQKYRCRCNASVVTAPGPVKLRPGSHYSIDFAIEVAAAKYLDHAPLERQCRIMHRDGLAIDSQTLWDQIRVLADHLKPTYEAVGRHVLESPLLYADETSWRMMVEKPALKWWVWEVASEDAAYYRILDSRSQDSARTLLGDYNGTIMADGYSVYQALSHEGGGFRLATCWAHARRKFKDIEDDFPESHEMLTLIRELYSIESEIPSLRPELSDVAREEILYLRAKRREERSKALIARIRDWAYAQRVLPRSGLGKAIRYVLKYWRGLTAFLSDPQIPLDNNAAERGLRGIVVGRKNHYGSRSKRGIEVAAIFYTLFESAKLCGVEPKDYVRRAANAAITGSGPILVPHVLIESR